MNRENDNSSADQFGGIVDLLTRQTESLEQMARPYVIVDVYPRRYVNMLYFRIRNVGQTPAFDVCVRPTETVSIAGHSSSELNIFQQTITALGRGDEISFFVGSAVELFDEDEPASEFAVDVQYEDSKGRAYEDRQLVDTRLLRDLALELPAADEMLRKLERTRKEIEKIARYTERLRRRDIAESAAESLASAEDSAEESNSDEDNE
ncbi:MAG: hypothetical protein ACOC6F_00905 [bacterium]